MPVNLETQEPQLGFPDLAQFQLLIASVGVQSVSSVVNAPGKLLRKDPATQVTQVSRQDQVHSVSKFPNVTTFPLVVNNPLKSLSKSINTLDLVSSALTPYETIEYPVNTQNLSVTRLDTSQEVLKDIQTFESSVQYQSDILWTVLVEPSQQNIQSVLNSSSQFVTKFPATFEVDAEQVAPVPVVTKHIDTFELEVVDLEVTVEVGPTVYEVTVTKNIPSFYVIIDAIFSFGLALFNQDDTWLADVTTEDTWHSEFTHDDTWVAEIGVEDMLIVSRDHIEITVTLKQNITTNYNVPAGSTVKAAIIHPTLPVTLLGPVTLVENTHWTAGSNEVTAEFDAGSAISSSTAILEIQVSPPSGKVKSFFSVGITVKQDTID